MEVCTLFGGYCGGGELARTALATTDDDTLRKSERTVLPSAPIIVIIQIGRWTLNYDYETSIPAK